MIENLQAAFDSVESEFLAFDRVESKLSGRRDLHAFLLLERLVPGGARPLINHATHNEYFLDVDCAQLAKVATQNDITELRRCGIRYSDEYECLCVFA